MSAEHRYHCLQMINKRLRAPRFNDKASSQGNIYLRYIQAEMEHLSSMMYCCEICGSSADDMRIMYSGKLTADLCYCGLSVDLISCQQIAEMMLLQIVCCLYAVSFYNALQATINTLMRESVQLLQYVVLQRFTAHM